MYVNLKGEGARIQALQNAIKYNVSNKLHFYLRKLCALSTIEREYKVIMYISTIRVSTTSKTSNSKST
jgi:hypothetical protein